MASNTDNYHSKFKENLTCSLCFEVYNDSDRLPKGLPCFHTFCLSCLEKYVQKKLDFKLPCPLCNSPATIPDGGVRAIPTNVGLKAMLELLPQQQENIEDSCTGGTEEEKPRCSQHPEKECTMLCMSCKEVLCTRCIKSLAMGKDGNSITCSFLH